MHSANRDISHLITAGLNLIQQALTIYDNDLNLVIANRRFQEMFDLPDTLVNRGSPFADTVRYLAEAGDYGEVNDVDGFVADRVAQARAFQPHYMERTRSNGRTISVEGSPLPQGGWVAVYTDITSTKRQEALLRTHSEQLSDQLLTYAEELASTNRALSATVTALEEAKREISDAEARTRLTAEMMPAHLAHVDRNRRYTYSNRRLTSVMPGSKPDLIGRELVEVLGHPTYRQIAPYLDQAFDGQGSVFEFTHAPSSRRIRVALTPDPADGSVFILSMDITEETQSRTMLQQARRREMAAQLTSGLAHDFSNLLTIILGMQSRLQSQDLPSGAQDLVTATIAAARRGGTLLNRIADMTGPREYAPSPVALTEFLRDLETLARSAIPEEMRFDVNNLVGQISVLLDPGMLQDSLLNLILNARDACAPYGRITLTLRPVRDTWIEFCVTDTGPGFSDQALAHGTEPFFTTKGADGSGLGLSMVYDSTKLAGGRIMLGNTQDGGRVKLQLPLKLADSSVAECDSPHLVLLVEDQPDLRDTIRDMLRKAGHHVVEAASAPEALQILAGLTEISVILSDVMLAGEMTGIDLLDTYGHTDQITLLMTSLPQDHALYEAALARAPVLRKPFDAAQLYALLRPLRSLPHTPQPGSA